MSFSKKWADRSLESPDFFDAFFSIWIAVVVLCKVVASYNNRRCNNDREYVVEMFKSYCDLISSALSKHSNITNSLAARRGSTLGGAMVDTRNVELQRNFDTLSNFWLGKTSLTNQEEATYSAELFNKIRNNLFHGTKLYDSHSDEELLSKVIPLLQAIHAEIFNRFN